MKRKTILFLAMMTMLGMFIYAPFQLGGPGGMSVDLGYGYIFDPPAKGFVKGQVDFERLGMQWGAVVVATLFLLAMTKK